MISGTCRQFVKISLGVLLLAFGSACRQEPSPAEETAQPAPPEVDGRPNLLLIVADDLGYNDLGVFGSEIATPNIDRLAASGLVLTNFYSAPLCAPTRAELLSGTDHHRAGEGMMQVHVQDTPGYEGHLNERVVSLATRLKEAGYHTYMAGKWHLGFDEEQSAYARGFEQTFTLLDGGASHFADRTGVPAGTLAKYRENGKPLDQLPDDFYSTDYYTQKMIGFLGEGGADGKPFFAYLAYTAPHWPVQAPEADIERQRGRYDEGYDVLRERRFAGWKAAGMASDDAGLPRLPDDNVPWSSLSAEEQASSARTMEVYAAMIEHMDAQIGRVLQFLESTGRLDDTLIVFMSDNGAEAASGVGGAGRDADNSLDNIGRHGSFAYIGPGWAEAASASYYLHKYYAAEGGIRVPAIVSGPALGVPGGRLDSLIVDYDIAPTFLELAGADSSAYAGEPEVLPMTGRSFAAALRGEPFVNARGKDDPVGREHGGQAAIRRGDWKLLWVGNDSIYQGITPPEGGPHPWSGLPMPRERFDRGTPAGAPIGDGGPWQLFYLKQDPGEQHDLMAEYPEVMADLLMDWERYVADYGVIVKSGESADAAPE